MIFIQFSLWNNLCGTLKKLNLINHILRPRAIKPSPTYKLKRRLRSEYNETAHQPRDATEDDVADEV